MQSIHDAIRSAEHDTYYENGSDSYFIKLSPSVGVKLFMSPLMRDRNHQRHLEYAEVAPMVGGKIDVDFTGNTMYGFLVEIVETRQDMGWDAWCHVRESLQQWIRENDQSVRIRDTHAGNMGRTKSGKPVILDFSRCVDKDGFTYHSLSGIIEAVINNQYCSIRLTDDGHNWEVLPRAY